MYVLNQCACLTRPNKFGNVSRCSWCSLTPKSGEEPWKSLCLKAFLLALYTISKHVYICRPSWCDLRVNPLRAGSWVEGHLSPMHPTRGRSNIAKYDNWRIMVIIKSKEMLEQQFWISLERQLVLPFRIAPWGCYHSTFSRCYSSWSLASVCWVPSKALRFHEQTSRSNSMVWSPEATQFINLIILDWLFTK